MFSITIFRIKHVLDQFQQMDIWRMVAINEKVMIQLKREAK